MSTLKVLVNSINNPLISPALCTCSCDLYPFSKVKCVLKKKQNFSLLKMRIKNIPKENSQRKRSSIAG